MKIYIALKFVQAVRKCAARRRLGAMRSNWSLLSRYFIAARCDTNVLFRRKRIAWKKKTLI